MSLGIFQPNANTKLLLRFDNNCNDSSGNGNNGSSSNVSYGTGKFNSCGNFVSATPSSILLPSNLRMSGDFTFMAIINPISTWTGKCSILSDWGAGGNNISIHQINDYIQVQSNGFSIISSVYSINNNLFYLVVTRNATNLTIYINGEINKNTTGIDNSFISTNNIRIGSDLLLTPNSGFNGTIDELIILNSCLSAQQIKKTYNNYKGIFGII